MEKCVKEVKVALIMINATRRKLEKNSFKNYFTIVSYE